MREKHSYTAATCRRKHTSYSIHVKLDITCCKKRGQHAIDIACATEIRDMIIHITLKSAPGVKTKAFKPLKGENYMPKVLCNGGFGVASYNIEHSFSRRL
jgi:hypothetical protein